jgi:hypothetical protein
MHSHATWSVPTLLLLAATARLADTLNRIAAAGLAPASARGVVNRPPISTLREN